MRWNSGLVLAALVSCGITLTAAPEIHASPIQSLHVQLGSWNGSSFSPDGSDWNTFNSGNWAVVATAPGFGNPTLDGFNNVDLPGSQYWLYMANDGDGGATAVQITLGYASSSAVEVFTDSQDPLSSGTYTLVSGTGFSANLISGPQSTFDPAPRDQPTSGGLYTPDGSQDWVIGLNQSPSPVPEPPSGGEMVLGALALTALVFGKRRLHLCKARY